MQTAQESLQETRQSFVAVVQVMREEMAEQTVNNEEPETTNDTEAE